MEYPLSWIYMNALGVGTNKRRPHDLFDIVKETERTLKLSVS